jgi:septin family protein
MRAAQTAVAEGRRASSSSTSTSSLSRAGVLVHNNQAEETLTEERQRKAKDRTEELRRQSRESTDELKRDLASIRADLRTAKIGILMIALLVGLSGTSVL